MEFEYKVTVIVPVYNGEKTLARTMDSLFRQTISQGLMEIILIDDGSQDGSPQLCDQYAREHDNVRVIHQENQGVSAARNAGIRAAKGKYLLYLDGDDALSRESVENIVSFFDFRYAEIDLVTYRLSSQYEDGTKIPHARLRYLPATGVYELKTHPYISQTNINVCVKNSQWGKHYFNTMLELSEDQLYITQTLRKTGKIGFVNEAEYIYFRSSASSSTVKTRQAGLYGKRTAVLQKLLDIGKGNESMRFYCENVVLYNFLWNIKGNTFLPPKIGETRDPALMKQLVELVDQIPTEAIMQYPGMDIAYRFYLLSLKTAGRPFICAESSRLRIVNITGELSVQGTIQIVATQLEATSKGFYLLAYIKCLAFSFTEELPRLFVMLPGEKRKELPVFLSQYSCFWTKFETNRFYAFHLEIPGDRLGKVKFEVSLSGITYSTNFWYAAKQRVHPEMGCGYLIGKKYSLLCDAYGMEVIATDSDAIHKAKRSFEKKLWQEHKKQWLVRQLMKSLPNRRVWLYFDSHDSLDNGYYQFLHDVEKQDGIRRYYVYHADNPQMVEGKFSGRAKRGLVPFGSVKHKCLMASAEKILTAFIDCVNYLPFGPDTYKYYSNLFHYEVIYLQHGVMHAKLPNMYSKEKVWQADRVIVSTRFERENLLQLGYREQDILTCGMPRLDRLTERKTTSTERKILFAPSWRVGLVNTVNGAQTSVQTFYKSEYYSQFSAFLQNQKLREFLEREGLYLDVQIHPMFSCYYDSFQSVCSGRIRMTRQANAGEYLACITDFSSFMFDFLYLNKPVISFFPDREEFRAGSHSYNDFYYPIEDGFAIYCQEVHTVVDALEQLTQNKFALPSKWAKRAEGIYFGGDVTHSEALYRALTGE